MDRTFTADIIGISPGIILGIIPVGIIPVGIIPADIIPADIVLVDIMPDIMLVVSMRSLEVEREGSNPWVAYDPGKAASAAFSFCQRRSAHFDCPDRGSKLE